MARSNIRFIVTPKTKELFKRLRQTLSRSALYKVIVEFFDRRSQIIAGQIVKRYLSGSPLKRRTGQLAASILGRGEIIGGVPGFRIGSLRGPAQRYAAVQELGTRGAGGTLPTIRPVNAKALAMPVNRALTPAGVARWTGPRESPLDLRFIPFRRGVAVGALYDQDELSAIKASGDTLRDIEPYYLLLRKVDIRPTHFLRDGVKAALPKMAKDLERALRDMLEGKAPKLA